MEDLREKYSKYFIMESLTRGQIIVLTILLERVIDDYLCLHFGETKEKREELLNCVFGNERMTFESKKQVFQVLIEKYDNVFLSKNKSIFKDIENITIERNLVAHTLSNISSEVLNDVENKVSFRKFKNKEKIIDYTHKKIESHIDLILKTTKSITALNRQIKTSLHPGDTNLPTEAKASS